MQSDMEIDTKLCVERCLRRHAENKSKINEFFSFTLKSNSDALICTKYMKICGEPINEFAKLMCASEIIKNRLRSSSHRRHSTLPDFSCVLTFLRCQSSHEKSDHFDCS
jgi:hypothetical protein